MKNLRSSLLKPTDLIRSAIQKIDTSPFKICIIVNEQNQLLGTITDGDIRRGILRGLTMESLAEDVMNKKPTTATPDESSESKRRKMKKKLLRHLPIVDANNQLLNIETYDHFSDQLQMQNQVVLMAGGLGSRLGNLTSHTPKPMLTVGNKPLLETILCRLADNGFKKIFLSVNYKADIIENYFQDGAAFGLQIEYLHETQRLGTAGPLGLLPQRPEAPLIVMNADILTNVDFSRLLHFHEETRAQATMSIREYAIQVPYGVVRLDGHQIAGIDEKPIHRFFVNAGIYVVNPEVIDQIKHNEPIDMPVLFQNLIDAGRPVSAFPIREHWIDIGKIDDLERANVEFSEIIEKSEKK